MSWPFTGKDGLIEKVYMPYFHKKGEEAIPFFVNCKIPSMAFMAAYKELPPIEQMPETEKREMKQYIHSMFPDKTVEEKLIACKIVYAIGTIL